VIPCSWCCNLSRAYPCS